MSRWSHKEFDVDIRWEVDPSALEWPSADDFRSDSGLGCNREYEDLRRLPWRLFREALAYEKAFIARFADGGEDERDELLDALYEDEEAGCLLALDPGVASTVIALSASRCAPFTSCNGGAFGDGHLESYPLVVFHARPVLIPALVSCAEQAGVALVSHRGALQVFARRIPDMMGFAEVLHARRAELSTVRLIAPAARSRTQQLPLFGD